MNSEFQSILMDGEEILWCGQPQKFDTNDAEYAPKMRTSFIFWAIIAVILELCYLSMVLGTEFSVNWLVVLGIFIICAFFFYIRTTEAGKIRKLRYALTDKRIIIKNGYFNSCKYEDVSYCGIDEDKAGTKSLVCGSLTDHLGKGMEIRTMTILGLKRNQKEKDFADVATMYSLPDEAIEILKEKLPLGKVF